MQQKAGTQMPSSLPQSEPLQITAAVLNGLVAVNLMLNKNETWIEGGAWKVPPPPIIPNNPKNPSEFSAYGSGDGAIGMSGTIVYDIAGPESNAQPHQVVLTFNIPSHKSEANGATISAPLIYVGQVTGLEPWPPMLNLSYSIALP